MERRNIYNMVYTIALLIWSIILFIAPFQFSKFWAVGLFGIILYFIWRK